MPKGVPLKEETKRKIGDANRGKPGHKPGPRSEQWIARQKEAQKRRFGVTGLSKRERAALGFPERDPKCCLECGATFIPPKQVPQKQFCSLPCGHRYRKRNNPKYGEREAAYYAQRREEKIQYCRDYYKANGERQRARQSEYAKANRTYINFRTSLYRNRLKNNGPADKITRSGLIERDGPECPYCGEIPSKYTIDHVLPVSRGGTHTWDNVVLACMPCNRRKWNRTAEEYFAELARERG